jgi:hypothetical protein
MFIFISLNFNLTFFYITYKRLHVVIWIRKNDDSKKNKHGFYCLKTVNIMIFKNLNGMAKANAAFFKGLLHFQFFNNINAWIFYVLKFTIPFLYIFKLQLILFFLIWVWTWFCQCFESLSFDWFLTILRIYERFLAFKHGV